ncbi:hypothetical protein, partial [Microbacterium sp.]|uniref:hypothetical protein n=1 Tax=Microbacterium sp. TaxID=51671 RepID=UPI003A842C36
RDKASPLRQLLDQKFPNTRAVQSGYRSSEPILLVEGGTANAGTLGGAFDYAIRFVLNPMYDADLARSAFRGAPDLIAEIDAVIVAAQVATGIGDRETLYRASWALALLTEVYRVGWMPGSPLLDLRAKSQLDAAHLLDLAQPDAVRQLSQLRSIADAKLVPEIGPPLVLGPTFDGSLYCAADADMVANHLLLDLKTSLGAKVNKPGGRADRLDLLDLYQLVSYALFDFSDRYAIRRLGIYSARFGHLVTWNLSDLLEELAGHPVEVAHARALVRTALGA